MIDESIDSWFIPLKVSTLLCVQFPPLLKTLWKGLYDRVVPAGLLVFIQVFFIFHWSGTSHLLSCPTRNDNSWQNHTRGAAGRSNVLTVAEGFDKDQLINTFCWDSSQCENSKRVYRHMQLAYSEGWFQSMLTIFILFQLFGVFSAILLLKNSSVSSDWGWRCKQAKHMPLWRGSWVTSCVSKRWTQC